MAEKEYIEREAAYQTLTEYYHHTTEGMHSALREAISRVPAADVRPVVYCKDCVYSDKWYADRLICYLWNEHDGNSVFEDGFCNYGVKREKS